MDDTQYSRKLNYQKILLLRMSMTANDSIENFARNTFLSVLRIQCMLASPYTDDAGRFNAKTRLRARLRRKMEENMNEYDARDVEPVNNIFDFS